MIDVKSYIAKKEKGLISITKVGSGFVLSAKRFNPETSEEVNPEAQGFHIKELETMKKELQEAVANIDILIADANAL